MPTTAIRPSVDDVRAFIRVLRSQGVRVDGTWLAPEDDPERNLRRGDRVLDTSLGLITIAPRVLAEELLDQVSHDYADPEFVARRPEPRITPGPLPEPPF